jgi:Ca2+-binding RTX toxin-like protein
MPVINGTNASETIIGTDQNDSITPRDGNDTVYGLAGDDGINGYRNEEGRPIYWVTIGTLKAFGGPGNDVIGGKDGNDEIYGEDGDDAVWGMQGDDFISGGAGRDNLWGGGGNDKIFGDGGDDELVGESGNDTIYGGTGNDKIDGGDGDDSLYGEEGDDLILSQGGSDIIKAGDGDDWVNSYFSKTVDWFYYTYSGGIHIYGGDGNDTLTGTTDEDRIFGESGNDNLTGLAGNDYLDGGSGINFLSGGDGSNTYIVSNRTTFISDSSGKDSAIVSANFVKIPPTIGKVTYIDGALKLPNWLDALLDAEFVGQQLSRMDSTKTFNFNFAQNLPSYYDPSSQYGAGFKSFTKEQIAFTYIALSNIAALIDVTFKEVSSASGLNNITFANNSQKNTGGYAFGPYGTETGSDVFINGDLSDLTNPTNYFDSFVGVLNHELGHALGLPHPHENTPTLLAGDASGLNTIMSYDRPRSLVDFQLLDIAALQYIYGPSKKVRLGNDTYFISESTTNFIWDGVGIDIINASRTSKAVTIYLTPGYWGYLGLAPANHITAPGQVTVNFGTVIENLIGSYQADKLFGNEFANVIDGGSGNDLIEGWDGDDTLIGGQGDDQLIGGAGIDTAQFSSFRGNYKTSLSDKIFSVKDNRVVGDGVDSLNGVERIKFTDTSVAIDLDGNAGITARILGAVVGKQSLTNKEYVGIGLDLLDKGMSYSALAALALEAVGLNSNDKIVTALWTNVIGLAPTAAEKAPFINMLENGFSRGELAKLAAETQENAANIGLVGLAQTGIEYLPTS